MILHSFTIKNKILINFILLKLQIFVYDFWNVDCLFLIISLLIALKFPFDNISFVHHICIFQKEWIIFIEAVHFVKILVVCFSFLWKMHVSDITSFGCGNSRFCLCSLDVKNIVRHRDKRLCFFCYFFWTTANKVASLWLQQMWISGNSFLWTTWTLKNIQSNKFGYRFYAQCSFNLYFCFWLLFRK